MDVAVIGTGVIGTIYGQLLSGAGHEVVHIVRPGSAQTARRVTQVDLLDARSESPVEVKTAYRPNLTDRLDPQRLFDLILVSVRHYQLESLLPTLVSGAGESEILFFNGLWTSICRGGMRAQPDRCMTHNNVAALNLKKTVKIGEYSRYFGFWKLVSG